MKIFAKKTNNTFSAESSIEEGELESDTEGINPLVTVTKIDPTEIPEVTNKFLMRTEKPRDSDDKKRRSEDRNGSESRREKSFGWSKRQVPQSRSGRIIKGRGNFRYRTPTRSSRSRSFTPEHWKAATRKLIKFSEFEKLEEEKRKRDDEIKRRTEERKKRHDALQRGDGKKSFFELSQETTVAPVEIEVTKEPEKSINDELDYEADDIEEEVIKKKDVPLPKSRKIERSSPDRSKRNKRSRSRSARRDRSRDFNQRDYRDRRDGNDSRRRRDEGRHQERNNRFDRFRRDEKDSDRNGSKGYDRRERDRRRNSRSRSR